MSGPPQPEIKTHDPQPLGLTPRYIIDAKRVTEIGEAIRRYAAVGKPIPAEWILEMADIIRRDPGRFELIPI